ncbi:hypothetical protein U1Q18_030733 [Sarracenia purpurea var. burkii]
MTNLVVELEFANLVAELGFADLVDELGLTDLVVDLRLAARWESLLGRGHCLAGVADLRGFGCTELIILIGSSSGSQQQGRWCHFSGKLDPSELLPLGRLRRPSIRRRPCETSPCRRRDAVIIDESTNCSRRSEDLRLATFLVGQGFFLEFSSLLVVAVAIDGAGGENKQKMKGQEWCIGGDTARAQSLF